MHGCRCGNDLVPRSHFGSSPKPRINMSVLDGWSDNESPQTPVPMQKAQLLITPDKVTFRESFRKAKNTDEHKDECKEKNCVRCKYLWGEKKWRSRWRSSLRLGAGWGEEITTNHYAKDLLFLQPKPTNGERGLVCICCDGTDKSSPFSTGTGWTTQILQICNLKKHVGTEKHKNNVKKFFEH